MAQLVDTKHAQTWPSQVTCCTCPVLMAALPTTIPVDLFIQDFHDKLYGKGEAFLHSLMKKVTFTASAFDDLQRSLDELKPTRHKEAYDATSNGMGLKYSILDALYNETASGRPPHLIVEDGDSPRTEDMDVPLPATFTVLDLRSLKLRHTPFDESVILVRKEYDQVVSILTETKDRGARASAIVSGQSGIGDIVLLCVRVAC